MEQKIDWLNRNSRQFLSRGYLKSDETAESRMEDIAKTAENILNINGFAKKFLKQNTSYTHDCSLY